MEEAPLLKTGNESDADDCGDDFEHRVEGVFGRGCVLTLKALSGMSLASGVLLIVVNLYEMIDFRESIKMYAVRTYNIIFGILIVIGEFERPHFVIEYFRFLKSWITKGLFIAFVGLLTLDTEDSNESLLQTVCALITFSLGALYFLAGVCCCPLRLSSRNYRRIPTKTKEDVDTEAPRSFYLDRKNSPQTPPPPPHAPASEAMPSCSDSEKRLTWLDPRQDNN
mmetsp:Transcript_13777/g.18387  ORF Transcript_13777/g.18387 Transcript_13777/m.18387 type:complete len:224 (+) Transcript_13777:76-747(+)